MAEGTHYYHKSGEPCYTVVGKNGKERAATLRDAREKNLLPSVTTIMSCASRPQLEAWMIDQAILASMTLPRREGELEPDYIKRVKEDAKETGRKAAERGTKIHAIIERGFNGESINGDGVFYQIAKEEIEKHCGSVKWEVEKSFAKEDYAGKIDLYSDEFILDIKTTDKDLTNIKTYDSHAIQLAAYRDNHKCGILYISTLIDAKLIWIPEEDLVKGMKQFTALKDYWYATTGLITDSQLPE